jgi:glucan 1,3-beta-glucosidase
MIPFTLTLKYGVGSWMGKDDRKLCKIKLFLLSNNLPCFPSCSFSCPERAIDTHIYQAWRNPDSRIGYFQDACATKKAIAAMEREFGPVIVGEWSLATDNCAMWLNGFNDNLSGYPRLPCKYIPCSDPYMGNGQPGAPVDPTKPMQGPYGTGMSGPSFGLCPVDRDWIKESSGNPQTG